MRTIIIPLALAMTASVAQAVPYTFTYTGNNFTVTEIVMQGNTVVNHVEYLNNYIAISFIQDLSSLSETFEPSAFSISMISQSTINGNKPINTSAPPTPGYGLIHVFSSVTVSDGNVTAWNFNVEENSLQYQSDLIFASSWDGTTGTDSFNYISIGGIHRFGSSINSPGSWTITPTSSVPEPSSVLPLGISLAGLGLLRKKFKA